jgi:hypothetical protein
MKRRLLRTISETVSRAIALVSLAAFLAAALEVPVPALQVKDLSRPFPCMHRRCGCMHADQCWGGCCCFTHQQKVAWAKEHGVRAPQYVADAAKRETAPQRKASQCCSKTGCSTAVASSKAAEPNSDRVLKSAAKSEFETLDQVSSRQCRGQAELWLTLGAAAPLAAQMELDHYRPLCDLLDLESPALSGITLLLATPPPRAAV